MKLNFWQWLGVALLVIGIAAYAYKRSGKHTAVQPQTLDSIADSVRARLPRGWSATVAGEQVLIERAEPIEWYNNIASPGFSSEEELRAFFRPYLHRDKFVISLRLGERLSSEQYDSQVRKNDEAIKKARTDARDGKLMPDNKFWQQHSEYGYREVPAFYVGSQAIYMRCQPGFWWGFWSKDVEAECHAVLETLKQLFRSYEKDEP